MKAMIAVLAALLLSACAGMPEERKYEIADWKARFHDDQKMCFAQGGLIVQNAPEVGGRYWCVQ